VNSDFFVFLLIFIYQAKPFTKKTIEMYLSHVKSLSKSPNQEVRLIASPSIKSKFSPTSFIQNSPCIKTKKFKDKAGIEILKKYAGTKNIENERSLEDLNFKLDFEFDESDTISPAKPERKKVYLNLKNLEPELRSKKADLSEIKIDLDVINYSSIVVKQKNSDDEFEYFNSDQAISYEGTMLKYTENLELKPLWFKLCGKDLFCKTLIY
jgi:hypothetical protein